MQCEGLLFLSSYYHVSLILLRNFPDLIEFTDIIISTKPVLKARGKSNIPARFRKSNL